MPDDISPEAAAAAAATAAAAAAATTGAKWYSTLDTDTQAYITNRGLTDKDAATAFAEAAKGHREAQAYIGAPAEQLLRLPKDDAGPDEWKPVWQRLGAPKDATGYDFSAVKPAEGELDTVLADRIRATALANNLPVKAAQDVAAAIVKYNDERRATETTERDTAIQASRDGLKTAWGANYEPNMVLAKNAATALGVGPEAVGALEKVIGYDKVMELFRNVGSKIGEDKFVSSQGLNTGGGLHTPASAKEKINELMGDQDWAKRYLSGGSVERKEMDSLQAIAAGVQKAA